ncbi:MAG TPA: hypothetical protein VFA06_04760 [Actinocrinis sp.]|uniref:hypothetical protein n=1 Tax=Actinocrinis sp. TaxID=1920516 RepID=UPI002D31397A|nr:hypothetical protein [Actinocrinis sp.]HZU55156.1 hypothetical protein [Actinocrinis sp.]
MTAQSTESPMARGLEDAGRRLGRDVVRTTCGREFTVSGLRLERLAHPAARVSLSTSPLPQDGDTLWASFTPQEARRLAAHLLAHAAAAESDAASAVRSTDVDYIDSRQYAVHVGGRHLLLDPVGGPSGHDAVSDLLAAALAVELTRRAERFLARHEIRRDGLRVSVSAADRGAGRTLTALVTTPPSLGGERKNALRALLTRSVLREAAHCRPAIEIEIDVR